MIQAVTEKIFKAVATRRWRSGCGARGVVAGAFAADALGVDAFGASGLVGVFLGVGLSGVVLTFITFLDAKMLWVLGCLV